MKISNWRTKMEERKKWIFQATRSFRSAVILFISADKLNNSSRWCTFSSREGVQFRNNVMLSPQHTFSHISNSSRCCSNSSTSKKINDLKPDPSKVPLIKSDVLLWNSSRLLVQSHGKQPPAHGEVETNRCHLDKQTYRHRLCRGGRCLLVSVA